MITILRWLDIEHNLALIRLKDDIFLAIAAGLWLWSEKQKPKHQKRQIESYEYPAPGGVPNAYALAPDAIPKT